MIMICSVEWSIQINFVTLHDQFTCMVSQVMHGFHKLDYVPSACQQSTVLHVYVFIAESSLCVYITVFLIVKEATKIL